MGSKPLGHREEATHDIRSGIVCEGSGYLPKGDRRQLHGPQQVYNLLHEVLLNEANDGFVFADLACGTAPFSAVALSGTGVSRYIGIDISNPHLKSQRTRSPL